MFSLHGTTRHSFLPQDPWTRVSHNPGFNQHKTGQINDAPKFQVAGSWLPLACLLLFTFVFTVGLGPVPWVFLGELFPSDVRYIQGMQWMVDSSVLIFSNCCLTFDNCRSYAAGCTTCCCFAFIFLANFTYPYLILQIQNYGVFWLYAAVSAVGLLFCLFLVPETKDRTLEEIENHFTQADGLMSLFTTIPPSLPPRDESQLDKVSGHEDEHMWQERYLKR